MYIYNVHTILYMYIIRYIYILYITYIYYIIYIYIYSIYIYIYIHTYIHIYIYICIHILIGMQCIVCTLSLYHVIIFMCCCIHIIFRIDHSHWLSDVRYDICNVVYPKINHQKVIAMFICPWVL